MKICVKARVSPLECLAVDMGASGGRVVSGSCDGVRIKIQEVHRYPNEPVRAGGTLYWDILRLFHEMTIGLGRASAAAHSAGGRIDSVGVDSWGNDFGLLDRKGVLLGNPVHYRDRRSEGMMEKVIALCGKREIFNQTGIQFMRFNALYHLFSMIDSGQPSLGIADSLLTIPDIMIHFLTGERINEFTNATTTQMFDPARMDWSWPLLEKLDIPPGIFGNIVQPGSTVGAFSRDVATRTGIGKSKVVAVGQHDTASAIAAVPAGEKDFLYISSGTWSLVGTETDRPVINDDTFQGNFTNEGGVLGTNRLLKNVMGLWIVQECKRFWDDSGEIHSFAGLADLAAAAEAFRSFVDPDSAEFGEPGDMPEKVRKYCIRTAQPAPDSPGGIIRCVLESLAFKYRHVIDSLQGITGKTCDTIHIVGGGSHNELLCSLTASACGKRVLAGPAEATALGNLLMQISALEGIRDIRVLRAMVRNSFTLCEYLPEAGDVWEEAYGRFRKVCAQAVFVLPHAEI